MNRTPALVAFCAAAALASSALAGVVAVPPTVTWGPATTIAGDADVSTLGTAVTAFNFGTPGSAFQTTVNGVTFEPFTLPLIPARNSFTVGDVTLRESDPDGRLFGFDDGGSSQSPYADLSDDYRALLDNYVVSGFTSSLQLIVDGLTPGQQYEVQVFAHNSGVDNATVIAGGPTLENSMPASDGAVGQYATGTFIANGTSPVISMDGDPSREGTDSFGPVPLLTGFQLRAIPEPTSLALLGLGGVALLRRRAVV